MGANQMMRFYCSMFWLALVALQLAACASDSEQAPEARDHSNRLTITGVTLYSSPDAEPLVDATVEITSGIITAITQGQPASIKGQHLAAGGKVATAGLTNSHVHFTQPRLFQEPQAVLNQMLLQYGFTQVVDTGSDPAGTLRLREAIRSGELTGPRILMANGSFVGLGGSPSYLPGITLPEITATAQASPMVQAVLAQGADAIKIFSGSFITREKTVYIEPAVIEAIVTAAHDANSLVFAHPTTVRGLSAAVAAGVDVIAHTTAPEIDISAEILTVMRERNTALVPTLKLWRYEMNKFDLGQAQADFMEQAAVAQLRLLRAANIAILFGTDVGYMTDYDPTSEYQLMQQAGMTWRDILRSATTEPGLRYGFGPGTVTVGDQADLVIYSKDPRQDVANFSQVAHTIVNGALVWSQ